MDKTIKETIDESQNSARNTVTTSLKHREDNNFENKDSYEENIKAIKNLIKKQERKSAILEAELRERFAKSSMFVVAKVVKDVNKPDECNKDDHKNIKKANEITDSETSNIKCTKKIENINNGDDDVAEFEAKAAELFEKHQEENFLVASSVMDIILSESEAKLAQKNNIKQSQSLGKAPNPMALSVGSRVQAKDFSEQWHPAEIVEVDYDEMEVLVHYENVTKRCDEWISVSSPRLRPIDSDTTEAKEEIQCTSESASAAVKKEIIDKATEKMKDNVKEKNKEKFKDKAKEKVKETVKIKYKVGERCLARWRDNRRFVATVHAALGKGKYEVVFDDGAHWVCNSSRMYKLKDDPIAMMIAPVNVQGTQVNPSASTFTPQKSNTTTSISVTPPTLPFHTHLFDPTRDYLGPKSERREMKRKLNIKEIFNIGQKRKKEQTPDKPAKRVKIEKKPKADKKRDDDTTYSPVNVEIKVEIPDAVAAIIGTVKTEICSDTELSEQTNDSVFVVDPNVKLDDECKTEVGSDSPSNSEVQNEDNNTEDQAVEAEEALDDIKNTELEKPKENISPLEDDLVKTESPKPIVQEEENLETTPNKTIDVEEALPEKEKKKHMSKIKKAKKLRLLQEKRVKKEVEKVKNELEAMKSQLEEMKKQVGLKTNSLYTKPEEETTLMTPESFLLPGEWCCKWHNGQPVGIVSEIECELKDGSGKRGLPRRIVQVEDKRLPPGWNKFMVRRSLGHSAGQWDVLLVSPENKRLHTRAEMKNYLEAIKDPSLKEYENCLMDFGVHRKLSRRLGWYTVSEGGETVPPLPADLLPATSPLLNRSKLSLKRKVEKVKVSKKNIKKKRAQTQIGFENTKSEVEIATAGVTTTSVTADNLAIPAPEDGYVYVGSLKVQILDNLLRCPAEGCYKNFRNNTLLQMHIKHYHRELKKMLGSTPKVSDLAYARASPIKETEQKVPRQKGGKKRMEEPKIENKDANIELPAMGTSTTPVKADSDKSPQLDSPKLRNALVGKPVKRPRVLLPVRRTDQIPDELKSDNELDHATDTKIVVATPEKIEELDFESAISTHTVTKPVIENIKKKGKAKRKTFAAVSKVKTMSDEEDWCANSDYETRSSFPRSGTPDSKVMDKSLDTPTMPVSSESTEDQKNPSMYMFTETGEKIKIVHMKREEIINCHCGIREEDGLMIQCELCLCWQHALCHNIQKEAEVPEKYTCSICLNPRRGRRSQRFLHDQDRLYEGLLPGAKPCETLKRSHELSGNLLRIKDALHALRIKYHVSTKKDHPKLYLWAEDWECSDLNYTQEKLNNDYSDLNIMISDIGKENLPIKTDEINNMSFSDIRTPPSEDPEAERFTARESSQLGSQALLSGFLSSPGGASLDLPISTSDLERLAKSVQVEPSRVPAPEPEAPIEDGACRERLLRHVRRCQALLDSRLDSIEAQVAELESQDPSFEDDETAEFYPKTKQTIQMLARDLDVMEELGIIT